MAASTDSSHRDECIWFPSCCFHPCYLPNLSLPQLLLLSYSLTRTSPSLPMSLLCISLHAYLLAQRLLNISAGLCSQLTLCIFIFFGTIPQATQTYSPHCCTSLCPAMQTNKAYPSLHYFIYPLPEFQLRIFSCFSCYFFSKEMSHHQILFVELGKSHVTWACHSCHGGAGFFVICCQRKTKPLKKQGLIDLLLKVCLCIINPVSAESRDALPFQ